MPVWNPKANELFLAALDIEAPDARQIHLDAACGIDADLRKQVEALLQAHAAANSFLEQPADAQGTGAFIPAVAGAASAASSPSEQQGDRVGPYKLLQLLGEGGMGTVWVAEQEQPVKRRVALKLIKAGMDSAQVLRRFEAERQALALMDHTNIAKVLDAGTTLRGRPYFAMELIKGVPITKYCDELHLSLRERLELFVPVCQAIQHAHQKGIIHRDIKPSNVLVAVQDGKPVPKVIDFGVAKAMQQRLTDRSMYTEIGAVIGTLEYMSPEQAELSALDIDTRADVYALGVLLYELLTGSTPLDRKRLKQAAYAEMLRIIKEDEPPKPSTRLTDSQDSLASLAAQRRMEPAKLTKALRGELDWIVMKCLEKDRTRRYETANGLARDVQRHLADETVEACPPSAGYRLRKFARKNRVALTTVTALAVMLLTGAAVSIWQAVRATRAQGEAIAARNAEAERAEGERKARESAQKRLVQIEKGTEILGSIFKDLDPRAEQKEGKALRLLLGERLDGAVKQLEGEAIGDPLAVARLQLILGECLFGLGYSEKALDLFTKARSKLTEVVGVSDPLTLFSMNNVAVCYLTAGKLDLALPLYQEVLRLRQSTLGPDHLDTLVSMNNLAAGYRKAGKLDLALPLFEETLKRRKAILGLDHAHTLESMNNLAGGFQDAGKLDLALPLFEETLRLRTAKFGIDHPITLTSTSNLALAYKDAGKLDLAIPMWTETLKLAKEKLGLDHPETLAGMTNLASGYRAAGKVDLALPLYEEALRLTRAKLGPDHPDTLNSIHALAGGYTTAKKFDLALPLAEEAVHRIRATLGPDHPQTLSAMNNLAVGYRTAGKLDLALPLYQETLKQRVAKVGSEHPHTIISMAGLACVYRDLGKWDLALPHFQQAATQIERRKYVDEYAGPIIADLSSCYEQLQQFDAAEEWRRKWLVVVKERSGTESAAYGAAIAALGANISAQQKYAEATPILRESLVIREKLEPDAWTTFNTKSMLGGSLLGQKKYADAESLLIDGYEGMKQRHDRRDKLGGSPIAPRLTEAIERLIHLYDEWGKPDEAAKWKKELEALKDANSPAKP